MNNKKIITILLSLTIIFTVIGGSLAYWAWDTTEDQKTNVVFTLEQSFSCAADGGGNISATDVALAPTDCTNSELAIQRTVTVTPTINVDDLSISMDLWLDVNTLGTGLSNSVNFKYALTTSNNSCTDGVVSSGNFNGLTTGDSVSLLNKKVYSATTTETYYLYVWLDKEETSLETMNQEFSLSLNGSCTDTPQPESPVLDNGMIPVTISNDGTVTTISKTDSSWYDYSNKEWANAILVSDSSRTNYSGTTGKTVSTSDILAYYVWIPRYKYMIPQTTCASIPESERTMEAYPECYAPYTISGVEKSEFVAYAEDYLYCEASEESLADAEILVDYVLEHGKYYGMSLADIVAGYNSGESPCGYTPSGTITIGASDFNANNTISGETSIDIAFELSTTKLSTGNATTSYKTHPAFWWDNDSDGVVDSGETVAGIWVGKFETSANTDSTCYTSNSTANCVPTNVSPRIVPNVKSLRYQIVSNQFSTAQKFSASSNTYGLSSTTTNAHMMKNSEWGAVAYLSHSEYGIDGEIRINNNSSYTTGCGASAANGSSTSTCQIAYGGVTSGEYPQSTTGNISGVFDMSGGAWEYVMGHYGSTIDDEWDYSGFTSMPSSKYYDLYSPDQFTGYYIGNTTLCTLDTCGGHALLETANWYQDYAVFVSSGWPWFRRGGAASAGAGAGAFVFAGGVGVASRGARCLLSGMERSDLLFSDNVVTM